MTCNLVLCPFNDIGVDLNGTVLVLLVHFLHSFLFHSLLLLSLSISTLIERGDRFLYLPLCCLLSYIKAVRNGKRRPSHSYYCLECFHSQHQNIFQFTLDRIFIAKPNVRIMLAQSELNILRSVAERSHCHTQDIRHSRQEIKTILSTVFLDLTEHFVKLLRACLCDDLLCSTLIISVIRKRDPVLIKVT